MKNNYKCTPEKYGCTYLGVTLKNMSVPLKNMGVPLKKFVKSKAPLQNNSIVFDSTPEKITEEFHGSSIEGGGGRGGG